MSSSDSGPVPVRPATGLRGPTKEQLLSELHGLERKLTVASVIEAIRLLESDKFHLLTNEHIRDIAEYGAVEIGGEWFFKKAFTTGKEVSGSLGFAKYLGREVVLDDLVRLRATLTGNSEIPSVSAEAAGI